MKIEIDSKSDNGCQVDPIPSDSRNINFFEHLPDELLFEVNQHLEAKELASTAMVARDWKRIAYDELLWARLCDTDEVDEEQISSERVDQENTSFSYSSLYRNTVREMQEAVPDMLKNEKKFFDYLFRVEGDYLYGSYLSRAPVQDVNGRRLDSSSMGNQFKINYFSIIDSESVQNYQRYVDKLSAVKNPFERCKLAFFLSSVLWFSKILSFEMQEGFRNGYRNFMDEVVGQISIQEELELFQEVLNIDVGDIRSFDEFFHKLHQNPREDFIEKFWLYYFPRITASVAMIHFNRINYSGHHIVQLRRGGGIVQEFGVELTYFPLPTKISRPCRGIYDRIQRLFERCFAFLQKFFYNPSDFEYHPQCRRSHVYMRPFAFMDFCVIFLKHLEKQVPDGLSLKELNFFHHLDDSNDIREET